MAIESWLPIGFPLPGGSHCGKVLHEGPDWQIVAIDGDTGGRALLAKERQHRAWLAAGLVEEGFFSPFSFGAADLVAAPSSPSQMLSPLEACRSPNSKAEAMAFALALKATREADRASSLAGAIYFERLGRLLPSQGTGPGEEGDDVVLGRWLTGGIQVSAGATRRLGQIMSWLGKEQLAEVVSASGISRLAKATQGDGPDGVPPHDTESVDDDPEAPARPKGQSGLDDGQPFELAGRPELEAFFNEHVVDIVRHQERYAALGIGFPAAIALHGPPGCGKTYAVEQLVRFLGWPCFHVDAASVASPYIHETSKKVSEVFKAAMKNAPAVLVIDEMEAFLADRETGNGSSQHRVEEVAEFLRRIPEASGNEVLIVGMTNRIHLIDPAILRRGRFDHVVAVELASEEEIAALLDKLLQPLPKADGLQLKTLAARLAGRPLSDVAFVVREGARLSARSGGARLEQRFLDEALSAALGRDDPSAGRRIGFV